MIQENSTNSSQVFITPAGMLDHWQGHRRLTRKVLEVYPEDKMDDYSIGGMRPFSTLILELLTMAAPTLRGFVTGVWEKQENFLHRSGKKFTKKELLEMWDQTTEEMNTLWPQLEPSRFAEKEKAFGQWEDTLHGLILYLVDNEIHHRGQAYVYLRSLGIEPPHFWDRS
jgi:uncharacterized damage-inducible protein DinB